MLPVTPRPREAIGRMRFNRRSRNITRLLFVWLSGSPENRTQHNAVISRVWTTSPRLPCQSRAPRSRSSVGTTALVLRSSLGGLDCLLPKQACFHLHLCPIVLSVRTAGFEPAIPWPPTRCDNQASPRSASSTPWGSRTQALPGFVVPAPIRWTGRAERMKREG